MMDELDQLLEALLTESVALTKGSQRVMNDKNLVANLADAIRDDAASNPRAFAAGFSKQAKKLPDEALAQWFLENLDNKPRSQASVGLFAHRDHVRVWLALSGSASPKRKLPCTLAGFGKL